MTVNDIGPIFPKLNLGRHLKAEGVGRREVLNSPHTSAGKISSEHVISSRSCDRAAPLCSVPQKSEPPATSCAQLDPRVLGSVGRSSSAVL